MALGQLAPWLNINTQEWGNLAARGAQLDIERQRLAQQSEENNAANALRRDALQLNSKNTQTRQQQQAAAIALKMAQMQQAGLMGQEKIDQSGQTAAARLGLTADKNANTAAFQQGTLQNNQDRNQILTLAQTWKQQREAKKDQSTWPDTDSKAYTSLDKQIGDYFRAFTAATPAAQKDLQGKIEDLMGKQQAILDKHPTAGSTLQTGTGTTSAPDDSAAAALVRSPNLPANPKATSQSPSGNYSAPAFQVPAAAALTGGQSAAPGAKPKAPKDKVAMANAVALIYPEWTKKDVIDYVNAQ
jgi:hypothetical protein